MNSVIHQISTALRRRLSPDLRLKVEMGYLNDNLTRNNEVGVHIILNFLEDRFDKEFVAYLKALKADKIKEAKESGDCSR